MFAEIITDDSEVPKTFKLFGKLKDDVLKSITQNITDEKPKDLLKNEPYKGTVVLTMKNGNGEKATFTFIPENKINGKYYVIYRIENEGYKYKNLRTNVAEKILQLVSEY